MKKKLTTNDFLEMKTKKEPVAAVVLYENWMARQVEKANMDWVLVGDSVNMAIYGEESTAKNPPTMECMLKHADAVRHGAPNTFVVGDMPEGSYGNSESGIITGIYNAKDFIEDAGCDAIKLEGGINMARQVEHIVKNGISVMGHIGLTPQTVPMEKWGTVYGETAEEAMALLKDAEALEKAGAFAILLEKVAEECAAVITQKLNIPIFSIGAGRYCDGQLLLSCDILRSFDLFNIKFVKNYLTPQRLFDIATTASLNNTVSGFAELAKGCFNAYASDVKAKLFPEEKHVYRMKPGEFEKFQSMLS